MVISLSSASVIMWFGLAICATRSMSPSRSHMASTVCSVGPTIINELNRNRIIRINTTNNTASNGRRFSGSRFFYLFLNLGEYAGCPVSDGTANAESDLWKFLSATEINLYLVRVNWVTFDCNCIRYLEAVNFVLIRIFRLRT